eukprot:Tbor_TRINITY_DN5344_c0_g1::TRINITY_DN5344_c0_g1_i1::g.4165::m.4165
MDPHLNKIKWPSSLKLVLSFNFSQVQDESKMPLIEDNPPHTVYSILKSFHSTINLYKTPAEQLKVAFIIDFILDLFERCCAGCSLLTAGEKRTLHAILGRRLTNAGAATKPGGKRKRPVPLIEIDVNNSLHHRLQYSTVLSVEYLLRILATLPDLVHHYHILCGGVSFMEANKRNSSTSKGDFEDSFLWSVVNDLIIYIDENEKKYITPPSRYTSVVLD